MECTVEYFSTFGLSFVWRFVFFRSVVGGFSVQVSHITWPRYMEETYHSIEII